MATFPFRFETLYRAAGAPFGVTPSTAVVRVSAEVFDLRFGPWRLRTPVANIEGWARTGPFSKPKTLGPARLSLVDRGITFATNDDAALCVRFVEPVPCIDPLGWIRHPGVTVTVAEVDRLERALDRVTSGTLPDEDTAQWVARSPWAIAGDWLRFPGAIVLAVGRYLRDLPSVERSFERVGDPIEVDEPEQEGPDHQAIESGTGPAYERVYRVRIRGGHLGPDELTEALLADVNAASSEGVAVFERQRAAEGDRSIGDEYLVRMPGPWRSRVRVTDQHPTSFRFATLQGHMEAGHVEFRSWWSGNGDDRDANQDEDSERDLVFEIHSAARSGGRMFRVVYDRVPIAREIQLHMWLQFCRQVAALAGGRVEGKLEARTIRHEP